MSIERIRELNDQLRTTFRGGTIVISEGISALPVETQARIIHLVRTFQPEGEHKNGEFTIEGKRIRWNIPYFFKYLGRGKKHTKPLTPEDPSLTTRFLEIWMKGEYTKQRSALSAEK